MKNFIKEFGDDQKGRRIPVEPVSHPSEWGFEPDIKHITKKEPEETEDDDSISRNDLNEIVVEAILNFMNSSDCEPLELLEEQKIEVEKRIKEYCTRQGIMSIYFDENQQLNEAWVGAILDPTNKKSWLHLKQEKICKVPYAYRKPLMEFAKKIWNENKEDKQDILLENDNEVLQKYLNDLKQQVSNAHKEADDRYNEVAHQSTHYMSSNPFERFTTTTPDAQEGHRMALADGQYKMLKKKAMDLESRLRNLEKKLKK